MNIDILKTDPIIITQNWGGLGDNLQLSTLPECFARLGKTVYISNSSRYRNPEIKKLVWEDNPYVTGFVDAPGNAGEPQMRLFYEDLPPFTDFIGRIEASHGLAPQNKYPKIYYQPKISKKFLDTVIIDVSSITTAASAETIRVYLEYVISRFHYKTDELARLTFPNIPAGKNNFPIYGVRDESICNIYEYCDAIFSCKAFITVHSGAQSLAAAIKGYGKSPVIHCYATTVQFSRRGYIYDNIEYIVL